MKYSTTIFLSLLPLLAQGYAPIVNPDGSIKWDTAPAKPYTGDRSVPHVNPDGSITWGNGQDQAPAAGQPQAAKPPATTPKPAAPQQPKAQAPQQPKAQAPQQPKAQAPQQPKPQAPQQPAKPTPTLKPGEPIQAAPLDPTPAPPPGGCAPKGEGVMTWRVKNNYGIPLSVSYLNNADSPSAIGCPGAGQMAPSATTDIVFPTGWAGRMIVGKEVNTGDSLIEGSTTGWNDVDVSYVDGFSVPITCSNDKEVITGCNIDLFKTGQTCPNPAGAGGSICLNPTVTQFNGPATPFFQPCQGAAYTFPNDNIANSGNTQSKLVTCCIGTAEQGCPAPARQGHGNNQPSKRDVVGSQIKVYSAKHRHMLRHVRSVKDLHSI